MLHSAGSLVTEQGLEYLKPYALILYHQVVFSLKAYSLEQY